MMLTKYNILLTKIVFEKDKAMCQKAPGKAFREGISIKKLFKMFPNDDTAQAWFEKQRWPDGAYCPHCGSFNVQCNAKHPKMTHRCRDCPTKPFFSVKTGSLMHKSNLGYQVWAIAIYLFTTNLKGMSSTKMHRDLDITQKSAWFLVSKLRKAFETNDPKLTGIVEVDETYVGGKEGNKHASDKIRKGRVTAGKTAVVGMKARASKHVIAKVVPNTTKETLQTFVQDNTEEGTQIHTDENKAYQGLENHETTNHGAGEYVKGKVYTNGIESFWSMFKRAHKGTYHKMSAKHLHRYVREFAGRQNMRKMDTYEQMCLLVQGMSNKTLTYGELIQDKGEGLANLFYVD